MARQGMQSEKDIKQMEFESLKHVSPEQLEQRYQQIAQMKSLLFRQELKNRRVSKIKSKLYHKLKKREKDREEKKLIDYLEQIDPEAAEAYRMKEEQKKVEERLKLRHSSNNKFSKTLKRFGGMENESLKEAFNEMVKEKNALKSRTKTVQRKQQLMSSGEEDDSEEENSDDEEEIDEETLRKKAVSQIEKELQDIEGSQDENSASDDNSDEEGNIKVDFSKKGQGKNQNKKEDNKGIMGLKFMQRAEANKKEQLKEQAQMLIEQIREEQEILNSDEENNGSQKKGFLKAAAKFGGKALPVPEMNVPSEDLIRKAAQKLHEKVETGQTPVTVAAEEKKEIKSALKTEKKQSKKTNETKELEVTFDVKEDLKNFKTDQKKVISLSKEDQTLRNLFIT